MTKPTGSAELGALAAEYWEDLLRDHPLYASYLGDHRYDDRADDLSAQAERDWRERWVGMRGRLALVDENSLDETDRVTRELLQEELDNAVQAVDLQLAELASDQMQGVHADLLVVARQLRAPAPEHARKAVTRIGGLATMLDQAAARYREGLRRGRPPARINVERSLGQVDGYLAAPLDADPFIQLAGPDGWDAEPEWRAELAQAVRDTLRPAFARYRAVLADVLAPAARPDDRAGLVHLADGPALYRALIDRHTGLPLDADDLHEAGVEQLEGQLRAEFADAGQRAFGVSDLPEIFARLLRDPALRYSDGQQILAHAQRCLDDATLAIRDWFGLQPKAPCVLTPVPDYLAAHVPPAYYTPPAPDGSRPGEYHVNLHEPTERGRHSTASIAFHEAIPGHHLQLAIASERTDLPAFRRMSVGHTAFVEGWALYAERLADEMGLYLSDVDRLGMLASDAWRACRLVVDTGLHARGWSRQQAIDFMVAHLPVDLDTITVEVDRYIGMPGQALAYKVGQREILQLREQAMSRLGAGFDIKDFHNVVLGAATVSLPVLRRRVGEWVAGRGDAQG